MLLSICSWKRAVRLTTRWTLMKHGLPDVPSWSKWLKDVSLPYWWSKREPKLTYQTLPPSSKIGIDPTLLPYSEFKSFNSQDSSTSSTVPSSSTSKSSSPSVLVPISVNLPDLIWSDRPSRPTSEVFFLVQKYTGEDTASKLSKFRDKLKRMGSPGMVVSQLDEVAWLFNLRGSDIPYNPVSYFVLLKA